MPFRYERDDANRCVIVTMEGTFDKAEGFDILERLRLEDVGHYAVLYDLRRMTGQPTIEDMRLLRKEEVRATEGSRGPIAVVASDPDMYSVACTYAAIGRPQLSVGVFRDRKEAEAYLKVT